MRSHRISGLGRALADAGRAEILCVLATGRPRTAGELAAHLGLAPSTTSRHLSLLLDGGLVAVEPSGRHRYFRLRSAEITELLNLIEAMDLPHRPAGPERSATGITAARTCYDHLAGDLAVEIYRSMVARGLLDPPDDEGPRLTAAGHAHLRALGIDTQRLGAQPRPLVRACLDWEQRTHHLGGAAGASLLALMLDQGWLRRSNDRRILSVTGSGGRRLEEHFGVSVDRAAGAGPTDPQTIAVG